MSVDIRLGPRPDEPGPPLGGPESYSPEVHQQLVDDAAMIIARYPQSRSALLPLLHLVQAQDGYVTSAGVSFCADQLGLSKAEVSAVATFYSLYRRTPTGDYLIGVCTNTLCAILGGDAILETLESTLAVAAGETTSDGVITLENIECNAACDYAPVIMVNWEFFDNQNPCSAREIVEKIRNGQPLEPTRGATVCPFRHTSRILAGLPEEHTDNTSGAPGAATLAGLRAAQQHGTACSEKPVGNKDNSIIQDSGHS